MYSMNRYMGLSSEGIAVALPVEFPLHKTLTWVVVAVTAAAGWVIVTLAVAVHPLLSVTVTV